MIKSTKTIDVDPFLIEEAVPRARPARSAELIEGLYCFVDTDELRRLLCLMAGTELLSELCRSLSAAKSPRKVQFPPALL